MLGMSSEATAWVLILLIYGIYCGWAKYCEHRWPRPEDD